MAARSILGHRGIVPSDGSCMMACSTIEPCLKCVQVDHGPHGDGASLPGN
jgi:hypothetical protein